jgi:LacI family transcriptional regulator, repressor for deo operon, udp, cdd, tsx, nupC, and nupG
MGKRREQVTSATISDVASEAGVSVATVSRALRGLPNVSTDTRARVVEAAARLRYQPDPHASRLATGRTKTIGMAVPLLDRWYFGKVVAGVESVLTSSAHDLILYEVDGEAALRRFLSESAPYRKRTDGLILAELTVPRDLLTGLVAAGVVMATLGDQTGEFPSVCIDNEAAARLVMSHLIDLGHRRIGVIGGQSSAPIHFDVPDLRLRGALAALEDAGIPPAPAHVQSGAFTVNGGFEAMTKMLQHPEAPSAVFAFSDEMAIGAIRAVRDHGLEVPGDISVAGFDDHDVSWALGLTTVAQPVVGLGEGVARLLLERLDDPRAPARHLVHEVALVERATTGPAPATAGVPSQSSA